MKIHEYQAKEILRQHSIPIPQGKVAFSPDEAKEAATELGGRVVVKAQIHAGGRGKGGGVKIAKNADEAMQLAKQILGMTLVTHQTGPEGQKVKRVLIEETLPIEREFYLGVALDRTLQKPVFIASSAGGVEIEQVAVDTPDLILREPIEPGIGLSSFQARRLAFAMKIPTHLVEATTSAMAALASVYDSTDADLVEINPFVTTSDDRVAALDAKIDLDDNALFRHTNLKALRDLDEEESLEIDANEHGLNYIKLDGNIGCMVNGAGLAMATMDIIQYTGGSPANFLDVGGGASADQIKQGFRIILSDPNVKAILINIFGGILKIDTLAEGVVASAKELAIRVPIVLRLEGTNVELGRQILAESGMDFIVAENMQEAAEKVVMAVG
ncbi:MAG: ADP-forming succinate--CoA ligase subunit beta [Solibacterales bacterium]|nr:ADP-forming succinate--CoA ligase subunit beta [Bryobacterales bacterium]|tara:strand:- start:14120 stop:15277 length:1158 start_codon:yes stop_codon:yes gene_type:complete